MESLLISHYDKLSSPSASQLTNEALNQFGVPLFAEEVSNGYSICTKPGMRKLLLGICVFPLVEELCSPRAGYQDESS
jgi:hypothetical protein